MKKELRGQVAFITGGSRGIGFGIAQALVSQGMKVAITSRSEPGLADARSRLERGAPGTVLTHAVDVRDHAATARAVAATVATFGGLDVVVNNAGIGTFATIAEMTPAQWSEVIDTNVTGVFNVCHAALPELKKRGGGYIFNVSSLAGKNPFVGAGAYCASKAALNQFSEVLNQEIRHDNIKVTTLAPGSVATAFAGGDESKGADWKIATADIGELVIDLLQLDTRSLPSYIELRPSKPPKK
ncbi:MAG TPA: SDR family oxidoreductase [Vicinamibacterales bacterium]|nr:SDR family oxidoreductase [Vicinamibacterales bacterium]